jgi:hypothetical protein
MVSCKSGLNAMVAIRCEEIEIISGSENVEIAQKIEGFPSRKNTDLFVGIFHEQAKHDIDLQVPLFELRSRRLFSYF